MEAAMGLLDVLPFQVNLWKIQNICYDLSQNVYPDVQQKAARNDKTAGQWMASFRTLSEKLSILVT
jgi:hypothetical protein